MTCFHCLIVAVPLAGAARPSHLAVIRPAPDFALRSHDDKPFRLADLRGEVVLFSFIFTTCSGSCPATTARMNALVTELRRQELLGKGRVRLVSITLDPERDTPAALRRYRALYDIEGEHWQFLTGPPAEVKKVCDAWGMWAKPAANAQLDHPSRIFLLDPRSRIREVYSLEFFKPSWVIEDVRGLLAEEKPGGRP